MTSTIRLRFLMGCIVVLGWMSDTAAAPNALLPRPQEAHYGEGEFAVKGLTIGYAMKPTAEDKFAAEQLAAGLSAKTGKPVKVRSGKGAGAGIVLDRTGTGASLPGMNDTTGPDSREAYSIKVTTKGVEIRAPASAGLYYGAQTLLQMVEL